MGSHILRQMADFMTRLSRAESEGAGEREHALRDNRQLHHRLIVVSCESFIFDQQPTSSADQEIRDVVPFRL